MISEGGSVSIVEATEADASAILALQKLAFRSEAELHDDWSLPPLHDTEDGLRERFGDHVFLKVVEDSRIVGSVRACLRDGTCYIGRLIVEPGRQGRGIGTALMRAIEERFAGAPRFEIFTGHKSLRTIGLYQRLGYREFRRHPATDKVTIVFMEKGPGLSSSRR